MKRILVAVGALVALVAVLGVTSASAFPALRTIQLVSKKAVSAVVVDSSSFYVPALTTTSNYDTLGLQNPGGSLGVNGAAATLAQGSGIDVRSLGVDFFGAYGAGSSATAYGIAKLQIVGSASNWSGADSLSYLIQVSPNGVDWSSATLGKVTVTAADTYWDIPLTVDSDSATLTDLFANPYWRVILKGDTGGPFGGLKAYLSFFGESNQAPY